MRQKVSVKEVKPTAITTKNALVKQLLRCEQNKDFDEASKINSCIVAMLCNERTSGKYSQGIVNNLLKIKMEAG
jgi:hypothetical protein